MSDEAKKFFYELIMYPRGVLYSIYKDKGFLPILFIIAAVTILSVAIVGMISENI